MAHLSRVPLSYSDAKKAGFDPHTAIQVIKCPPHYSAEALGGCRYCKSKTHVHSVSSFGHGGPNPTFCEMIDKAVAKCGDKHEWWPQKYGRPNEANRFHLDYECRNCCFTLTNLWYLHVSVAGKFFSRWRNYGVYLENDYCNKVNDDHEVIKPGFQYNPFYPTVERCIFDASPRSPSFCLPAFGGNVRANSVYFRVGEPSDLVVGRMMANAWGKWVSCETNFPMPKDWDGEFSVTAMTGRNGTVRGLGFLGVFKFSGANKQTVTRSLNVIDRYIMDLYWDLSSDRSHVNITRLEMRPATVMEMRATMTEKELSKLPLELKAVKAIEESKPGLFDGDSGVASVEVDGMVVEMPWKKINDKQIGLLGFTMKTTLASALFNNNSSSGKRKTPEPDSVPDFGSASGNGDGEPPSKRAKH